jgi:hypothetical protein
MSKNTYLERVGQLRDVFANTRIVGLESVTSWFKGMELFITHSQSSEIEFNVTQAIDSLNCSPVGQHFGISNCLLTEEQNTIWMWTLRITINFKPLDITYIQKRSDANTNKRLNYVLNCIRLKVSLTSLSWYFTAVRRNKCPGSAWEVFSNHNKEVTQITNTGKRFAVHFLFVYYQTHCIITGMPHSWSSLQYRIIVHNSTQEWAVGSTSRLRNTTSLFQHSKETSVGLQQWQLIHH